MERKMKRFLSLLLALLMICSNPITAFAENGTEISSSESMQESSSEADTQSDTTEVDMQSDASEVDSTEAGVAKNSTTGASYDDVSEALLTASENETIVLLEDTSGVLVSVPENVTLDLNGHTLGASYVTCYGNVVDSGEENAGFLKVDENRFLIQKSNQQLPVKSGDGYAFYEVTKFNTRYQEDRNRYVFQPFIEKNAHDLMLQGAKSTGTTINVRVSWTQNDGKRSQDFVYIDEKVSDYLSSYYLEGDVEKFGRMFTLVLKGTEQFENLTFNAVLVSDTGVEIVSDPITVENNSGNVTTDENNQVTENVTLQNNQSSAVVNQGTQLEENTKELTLTVEEMDVTTSDITLEETEQMVSMNVHVNGVSADNTVPVIITLDEIAPEYLNQGNVKLYHVENGVTVEMTRVFSLEELDEHNEYYYDILTGTVRVALATFSEVAVVSDDENAWEGNFDYSWYTNAGVAAAENGSEITEYAIANADQLAAFGAIIGGMNGQTRDSFIDKTVELLADIDLGDAESNNTDKIFYPIGYYNNTGSYDKVSGGTVSSSVYSFEGTFDGNGHTIKNFYQNTWEMFGDYNSGYSGTPNHYNDAMGLFGYVVNGTVKNLTIDSFSSDGEFTPTGVAAAYAVNSTFENIAITNCNPRVYNTGNGGIIGVAGRSNEAEEAITLKNITVDNSNKISALWGSWDVACGGLVGMYRGNADSSGNPTGDKISFENCHVAAQIDVYNDVCANYQYYAYRYAGMIIGSVRHNTTDADGKTIPNMAGISATGCTVNYGDWNDYYYCEFEANTMASYSEDYQFSRVPHSELEFTDANGNGVVDADERSTVTGCTHTHTEAEDKQAVYLPFHQLFTGYSWGVSSIGLKKYSGIVTDLDISEGEQEESVDKFTYIGNTELSNNVAIKASELFSYIENCGVAVDSNAFHIGITDLDDTDGVVTVDFAPGDTWENSTITLTGTGRIRITVQDYKFCKPCSIEVNVITRQSEEKFEVAFDHDPDTEGNQNNIGTYLYRVGNANTVSLGSLFEAKDGAAIGNVSLIVEAQNDTAASGTYTSNTTWTNGTIQFSGTGVVKVTIRDDDTYCTPTELYLEVVDAVNATSAKSATANNVVLLNDCDFSTIDVKNGYTLYGNGYTMTNKNDVLYHSLTVGFVTLENGTLDNVQIVVPDFSHAVLYNSNMTESSNYYDSNSQKYGNVRSAVITSGNSKILNSHISGGRAAVYVTGGNPVIENSTIKGGAAANIHITASTVGMTLCDVTMIQVPTQATVHDTSKTLMGLSVLIMCDDDKYGAKLTLEGYLNQYAWAHEGYKSYVPTQGQSFVTTVLKQTDYIHQITYEDGVHDSLNLGFAFLPTGTTAPADPTTEGYIIDNRTDGKEYGAVDINGSAYVYSYKNSNGTSDGVKTEPEYSSSTQDAVLPTISYTDTNANRVFETKYDANNGWMSTLTVDVDAGTYDFSFDKLLAQKYGQNLSYTVTTVDGTTVDTSKAVTLNDSSTTEYILTITDNLIYGPNGENGGTSVEHKYTFELLSTKTSLPAPTWDCTDLTGTALRVGNSATTTDWNVALPVLDGLIVKYYSKAQGKEVKLALAEVPLGSVGKKSDTNTYTLTVENEYTLTVTTTGFHSTDNGKPTVSPNPTSKKNTLYFTSNTYVSKNTSERNVSISYSFTDANNSPALTHSTTWNVYYSDIQNATIYDPEKMFKGTTEKAECVTPDTLITLSDGSQVRVDSLTGSEELLVWNLETGSFDSAPIMFVDSDPEAEFEIIHLYFSDDTDVKVIYEHGFWDYDLNKYVYLDRDAEQYIGHVFAMQNGDELEKVTLTDVVLEKEVTTAWSPVTEDHLCYFVNGMLSMPGGIEGLFNIFDVDPETMAYDYEAMAQDIETYGLFTYEELNSIEPLSEEMFDAAGGAYLKISIGKGNLTMDDLRYMVRRYSEYFE